MTIRTYTIEGEDNVLDQLEKLFKAIEICGEIGTCQDLVAGVDGDGNGRLKFRRTDKDIKPTIQDEEEFEERLDQRDYEGDDIYFEIGG